MKNNPPSRMTEGFAVVINDYLDLLSLIVSYSSFQSFYDFRHGS